jgi:hypothetical protein
LETLVVLGFQIIKVFIGIGATCSPPKMKRALKEKRRGRQSVLPVARLGTVPEHTRFLAQKA